MCWCFMFVGMIVLCVFDCVLLVLVIYVVGSYCVSWLGLGILFVCFFLND